MPTINSKAPASKKKIFAAACLFALAFFSAHEFLLNFYPETLAQRNVIKFFISVIPLLLSFFAWRTNKSALSLFTTLGLLLCCVGDVVINISLVVSIALYLVGHSLFIKGFFCCKKPRVFQFVLWGVMFLGICAWLLFFANVSVTQKIEGLVYSAFMCAMVAFSFCGPALVCAGGIVFGLSDVLLMLNIVLDTEKGLPHIIALGVYYVGVFLMAAHVFLVERPSAGKSSAGSID